MVKQGKDERPTLPDSKMNSAVLAYEYKINQWYRIESLGTDQWEFGIW